MNKSIQIILLIIAALLIVAGIKTISDSKSYHELPNIVRMDAIIHQLQCPQNGAASIALKNDDNIFHLSVKFRTTYCEDTKPKLLLGKSAQVEAVPVTKGYYQIYRLVVENEELLSPEEVISDRQNSVIGLFLIAFLLIGLVLYKRTKASKAS